MATHLPSLRRNTIVAAALLGTTLVLVLWGPVAREKTTTRHMQEKEHLVALTLPAQPLAVQFTQAPETFELRSHSKAGGIGRVLGHGWSVVETRDWALLNGIGARGLCPQLLTSLVAFNSPSQWMELATLEQLMAKHQGVAVQVAAHVPRFTAAPPGLAGCPHFDYDAARQAVTYKGKPIALLAKT